MPPIICTSKCRIFSTRRLASRQTAKASGSNLSSDSPAATRWRNSSVLPRNWSSVSFSICVSSALIVVTVFGIA